MRIDAGVSWAYYFYENLFQAYRGAKIPPKIQIAPISPKIGVNVHIDLRDVVMLFVCWEKYVFQAYRGQISPPKNSISSDIHQN